ncbi:hypothetical protein NP233_g326 [Leucocoprinus birnbaumii]|uniref:Uncharacterized protein n=1 Tax=Leucocoprinus birnbaumii TaxID=56174 RepID=A0AAD5YWS6_9AGAR|nr:hypothetical protein NP233_g326 [Leucocoprinus birnbaumii]
MASCRPTRPTLASNRGTLMELAISPIVTSGMIMQLLAATVYVLPGLYRQPKDLGADVYLLLIIQHVAAALIVILLDKLLQKDYGLGSGISLFIVTTMIWKAFSPTAVNIARGPEFEGAIVVLFHLLLPGTIRFREQRGSYPVKLFYTSNMPIMLKSALTSNVFIVSQILATRFPSNSFVRLWGIWEPMEDSPRLRAVSGIACDMSPPHTMNEAILDPIHTAVYIAFMLSAFALFSKS